MVDAIGVALAWLLYGAGFWPIRAHAIVVVTGGKMVVDPSYFRPVDAITLVVTDRHIRQTDYFVVA